MADPATPAPKLEIAHVLFMDVVAYSTMAMDQQRLVLEQLQAIVSRNPEFIRSLQADQLIRLPTGDGMALVFFTDPETPVRCALGLARELRASPHIKMRIGIHTGPVYRVPDINANLNVSGGGINLAQRVMDCGDAGHILVSQAVADVVGEVSAWRAALHDLGEAEVKHGVRIHLFNVYTGEAGNPARPRKLRIAARRKAIRRSEVAIAIAAIFIAGLVSWFLHRRPGNYAIAPVKGRRSVAVLGFKNLSGRPDVGWLSTALSEMLTTELAGGEKLLTIPGENVARMKLDLSLPDTDSLARDTLQRIHSNLGSDLVVLGSYLDASGEIRLDMRIEDAVQGEMLAVLSESGSEKQLLALVATAGRELRRHCNAEAITPEQASEVQASLAPGAEVAQLYAEGLQRLRTFDAIAARDPLQRAAAINSNFALVHSALAETWAQLGYDEKGRQEAKRAVETSAGLSREQQLWIRAADRAANHDWPQAIQLYKTLFALYPDNLEYGLKVGETELAAGRPKDALLSIDELRKRAPQGGRDPRIDLMEAEAAGGTGDYKRQQQVAAHAADQAQQLGARLLLARALDVQGIAAQKLGNLELAKSEYEQARQIYVSVGDENGAADELNSLAGLFRDQGQIGKAREALERALVSYRRSGNQRSLEHTLGNLGNNLYAHGDLKGAMSLFQQSLAIAREVGDQRSQALTLDNFGNLHDDLGELNAAMHSYEQSAEVWKTIGDKDGEALASYHIGVMLYAQGELAAAHQRLREALAMAQQLEDKQRIGTILLSMGQIEEDQGDLSQARSTQERALSTAQAAGEELGVAGCRMWLAALFMDEGKPGQAIAPLQASIDAFHRQNVLDDETVGHYLLARAWLESGHTGEAQKEIRTARLLLQGNASPITHLFVGMIDARVEAATAAPGQALAKLRAIERKLGRMGYRGVQLEAQLAIGEIELHAGQTRLGRAHLLQLQKDAGGKGFELIARKAAAALKS